MTRKEKITNEEQMTGKGLRKIIQQLLLMCHMLKTLTYILPKLQNTT